MEYPGNIQISCNNLVLQAMIEQGRILYCLITSEKNMYNDLCSSKESKHTIQHSWKL